jgi:hypothetical protein
MQIWIVQVYVMMYTASQVERLLFDREASVTVVDPRGYMTYQPFLAEVAGGWIEPRHVISALPEVLRHTKVLTGRIVSFDHASRLAVFAPTYGRERLLRYDVLVMAAGSVSRVVPIEGLAENGAGVKTLGERVHLRNHVLSQLGSERVHGRRGADPGWAGSRRCRAEWPGPRRRAGRSRSRLGHRRGRCRPRASPSARGRAREPGPACMSTGSSGGPARARPGRSPGVSW